MDSYSNEKLGDAGFDETTRLRHEPPAAGVVAVAQRARPAESLLNYHELVRNPCSVCNDWFYRFLQRLPGHPLIWALAFGFALLLSTDGAVRPGDALSHVRSYTEMHASYFFLPVILVQVLVMPLFYQAVLRCFDGMRYAMQAGDEELARLRESLVTPDRASQLTILVVILVVCLISEEVSSSRLSRFATGDWNSLDIWLMVANSVALSMFLWYLAMPISRTLMLAKHIDTAVTPHLFDEKLGEPLAAFGLRAGLVFAVPYFFVGSFAPLVMSDSWTYVLPGVIGTVTAIGFSVLPSRPLRRIRREQKRMEMQRVSQAVIELREAESGASLPVGNLSEIVALLEYGREVRTLREWPFEAQNLRRFGLYFLLIPMTWVGAAFVEMIVEQLATW